jgi:hypothetical protein
MHGFIGYMVMNISQHGTPMFIPYRNTSIKKYPFHIIHHLVSNSQNGIPSPRFLDHENLLSKRKNWEKIPIMYQGTKVMDHFSIKQTFLPDLRAASTV